MGNISVDKIGNVPWVDPKPGDTVLLVVEVTVLGRRMTPSGLRYVIEYPRDIGIEDFATEEAAEILADRRRAAGPVRA